MEMIIRMLLDNNTYIIDLKDVSCDDLEQLQKKYPYEVLGYR